MLENDKPTNREGKPRARGLADVTPREFVRVKAELATVMDGRVPTQGLILVTGPAGAGKSTLVAELALELERSKQRVVIIDAEMGDELAAELWTRAGATRRELAGLRRITDDDCGWSDALREAQRLRANVLVVDSVDEWSELAGRDAVLADIRRKGPLAAQMLILAIAHFAREGHLFGTVKADHRGDAVVIVEPEKISQRKCTWAARAERARG